MKKAFLLLGLMLLLSGCTRNASVEENMNTLQSLVPPTNTQATPEATAPDAYVPTPILGTSSAATPTPATPAPVEKKTAYATIKTNKGDITVLLYGEDAPKTVANFMAKAKSNYYAKLTFHRVEDWVIQGGDPKGNGTGGGTMPTELNSIPFRAGSLGVARGGDIEISNDSQFFICTTDCSWLTGQYTNFGEVVTGMEVVKNIAIGDTISKMNVDVK